MNLLSVTVGEYTVLQDEFGRVSALRYGEPWRNCVGDNLVLALAQEVERLREQYDKHIAEPAMQELVFQTQAEESYQKLLEAEKVIAELRTEIDQLNPKAVTFDTYRQQEMELEIARDLLFPLSLLPGKAAEYGVDYLAETVSDLVKQEADCAIEGQEKFKALQKEVTGLKQQVEELKAVCKFYQNGGTEL